MRKLHIIIVIWMIMSMFSACQAAPPAVQIQRHPQSENWLRETPASLPAFDPASIEPFQVDLRSKDLTQLDLSERLELDHSLSGRCLCSGSSGAAGHHTRALL